MGNYFTKKAKSYAYTWKIPIIISPNKHHFEISKIQTSIIQVDLRNKCPPIYDQEEFGNSIINAITSLIEFHELRQNQYINISRLFIHYNVLQDHQEITVDTCIKTINQYGTCQESSWPYCNKIKERPSENCYNEAIKNYKCIEFKELTQDLEQLKQCILSGFPFMVGIYLYDNFNIYSPDIPMPINNNNIGGIIIMIIGFDDDKQKFIFRGSFGTNYADKGYGYIPYEYIINSQYAADLWFIRDIKKINTEEAFTDSFDDDDYDVMETGDNFNNIDECDME
jgi:C1A family cysteine protease